MNYIMSSTSFQISCTHASLKIVNLFCSYLIFDNQFKYLSAVSYKLITLNKGSSTSQSQTISIQQSTFKIIKFLKSFDLTTRNSAQTQISFKLTSSFTATNYTLRAIFNINYISAYIGIRALILYPNRYAADKLQIDFYYQTIIPSPYLLEAEVPYFDANTNYMFGIQSFSYSYGIIGQGLTWNLTLTPSPLDTLTITLSFDDQFNRITYNYLIINSITTCQNLQYPFLGINRTNTYSQCFDSCYQNQYIEVDSATNQLTCVVCSNALCKTCEGPSACSSCIDYYDLEEAGSCILNSGYYEDISFNVFPCSNNIPGCMNCTSDGSTCNLCQSNYYNAGSSCTQCSTIDSNCIRCDSATTCLECLSPKVLLTQTLCGDPLPGPITPPGPPAPCTDVKCATCSTTDPNDCSSCTSALFTLENGKCSTTCGDGLIDGEVCDDGNTIDFDGCSSDCKKVEDGFTCDKIPAALLGYETSDCYFSRPISISVLSIKKPIDQNKVVLILENSEPKIRDWEQIDAGKELTAMFDFKVPRLQSSSAQSFFNFTLEFVKSQDKLAQIKKSLFSSSSSQVRTLQSQFDPSLYEYIELTVLYSGNSQESLNHQSVSLSLQPALSGSKLFSAVSVSLGSTITFDLVSDDNQIIQYFDESYYQYADTIFNLSAFVSILTVIMLIISFISFCVEGKNSKQLLIALEASFIVQFTYFSLSGIGELNPLFIKMAEGLKYSSGFDLLLSGSSNASRELLGIGIQSFSISDNVNVSVALVLICLIAGGVGMLLDKLIFSKKESEKVNNDSPRSNQEPQPTEQQSKCLKVSKFLIFNLGFTLFLYFLYKFIFFSAVQLKYGMSSFSGADAIILVVFAALLVFYLLMLFLKLENFATFTEKIKLRQSKFNVHDIVSRNNELSAVKVSQICQKFQKYVQELPNDQKPEVMWQISSEKSGIKIQFWYILIIFIEHIVNIFVLIVLSQSFAFHGMVPLAIYLFNLVFGCKYKFYTISNMWRLYAVYFIGILIQIVFLVRSFLMNEIMSTSGNQQMQLGLYFPFTVIIGLFLLCMLSLVYIAYSIKKIRCCQLQIEWQKLQLSSSMKLRLQQLIEQQNQINQKDQSAKNQKNDLKIIKLENGELCYQSSVNNNSKHPKDGYTSFNSNAGNILPISLLTPIKGILQMQTKKNSNKIKIDSNFENEANLDKPLNQQVTAKTLRKQIKQKLLNSKIQQKIKTFGDKKFETMEALNSISNQLQKASKSINIQQENINKGSDKALNNFWQNILQKKTIKGTNIAHQKIENTEHPVEYLYTDSKKYDTYQEFDMI